MINNNSIRTHVGTLDRRGGFYAPDSDIREDTIIWINKDDDIPAGYIHLLNADIEYLTAWLIYVLSGINDQNKFDFNDRKLITARAPGGYSVSDERPSHICVKIKTKDRVSLTYILEDHLSDSINFSKTGLSLRYNKEKLNSIIQDIKNLSAGRFELIFEHNDYSLRKINLET